MALFLVQTLLGGATAHYHAETGGFFGIDLARVLPYNLTRTWHLQLALFFVVGAFLAAGIFLAPMITGREPRRQRLLALRLLGALVVVVVGSLAGEAASYKGWIRGDRRAVPRRAGHGIPRPRPPLADPPDRRPGSLVRHPLPRTAHEVRTESRGNLPYLFFYSALSIPAFYAVGLLARTRVRLRDRRFLALLGRAPLGRGLHGAVHDDHGGLPLRPAGRRVREDRHPRRLPRHPALLVRRRGRDDAPPLLQRHARRSTWPSARSSPPRKSSR